ncbi:SMP-30/gluconolactonase/LRE family protein [Phytoactinopolyspora limicola]|uniref:SMP-30/gluconolactonase/LRE family protein n=1 Tax=Phytoactinopolyspora limicola TaxID=2715536 RepID=UPI00140D83DE|nr:SMP-30/gluconolactonase/LRE family protein [Phytoactinopolyspora limicola]
MTVTDGTILAELVTERDGPRTELGESPRWDGTAWWWVDAAAGQVWTRRPGGPALLVHDAGGRVSLVQPAVSGRVVIASGQTLLVVEEDPAGDGWRVAGTWCHLGLDEGWRVNDGVADAAGRLWIGSIAPERKQLGGTLLRVDTDGSVTQVTTGFTLTNGMAWNASGDTLFHVDTFERTVWAHRIDPDSGSLVGSRQVLTFADDDGLPDGIATDTDDGIWVAMYGRGEVRRYSADGTLTQVIGVEPPQATSVELGGPDGCDILITTAREGYDEDRSRAEPRAGRLYRARSSTPGLPKPKVVVASGELR